MLWGYVWKVTSQLCVKKVTFWRYSWSCTERCFQSCFSTVSGGARNVTKLLHYVFLGFIHFSHGVSRTAFRSAETQDKTYLCRINTKLFKTEEKPSHVHHSWCYKLLECKWKLFFWHKDNLSSSARADWTIRAIRKCSSWFHFSLCICHQYGLCWL